MWNFIFSCVVIFLLFQLNLPVNATLELPEDASVTTEWFQLVNAQLQILNHYTADVAWKLTVNPSPEMETNGNRLASVKTKWHSLRCEEGNHLTNLNETEARMIYLLCRGPKFDESEARKLSESISIMQNIYTQSRVCLPKDFTLCNGNFRSIWHSTFVETEDGQIYSIDFIDKNLHVTNVNRDTLRCYDGEPDLEKIISGDLSVFQIEMCSIDAALRSEVYLWVWESWRLAVGPRIKFVYPYVVNLMNVGAVREGYNDIGSVWQEELEIINLRTLMKSLWKDVKPFYKLLHTVVRHYLSKIYSDIDEGPIPAHLLGNLWSQNWASLIDLITPIPKYDLDAQLSKANWTTESMVRRAEDFYSSMGLFEMTQTFWDESQFEKLNNSLRCHGTAADMFAPNDFRMIGCAQKTLEDFYVIVHEMGHIEYYMSYKQQPIIFQEGTNTAFQESIGDTIFLGLMAPQHLHRLRLINDSNLMYNGQVEDNSFDLYLLMKIALAKIPQIPFEYIIDLLRWDLFSGSISMENSNDYFWLLSEMEQGIKPPSQSGDRHNLFDAGAKYHISDNTPYVRYFLASFLQYQIFEGICRISVFGSFNYKSDLPMPLHRCDIYGSKKAGNILKKAMSLGSSAHWTEVLYILTGKREITADSLLKYYEPLIEYLQKLVKNENFM